MKREIRTIRLAAATVAALGAFTLGSAPASAQYHSPYVSPSVPADISQDIPWYLPPPWVYPQQTGPKIRKLPGYYGHRLTYRQRNYGSFANYCYGDCPDYLPGTVVSGYGYILQRPAVAVFNPNDYQLVARAPLQTLPELPAATSRRAPAQPAVVSVRTPTPRLVDLEPKFTLQNGVRIIRPTRSAAY
jgi:hypothetical protein